MNSFALRGHRSPRRTFFRGFVPRYPYGQRGRMGGLLKVALLGACTYFIAKKLSYSNHAAPPQADSIQPGQSELR
ncbi:hypothetical protein FE257_001374 [Aspergillus nanangensis]|uniref:Uncharacterized protein n=1 Tax=Aspergillus nanangensis TaxID=2582783 RepID=A0AAD4GPQ0_ASPNN|nr:hypothetical protein FE257_001374 [Aspergillus nanangensis]